MQATNVARRPSRSVEDNVEMAQSQRESENSHGVHAPDHASTSNSDQDDPKIHASWASAVGFSTWGARLRSVRILGLEPSPELLAISMVYFVQGILGLSRLALSFFLKDELHIEPAEAAVLISLSHLPWMVKPLYGFISDSVPLFGLRRRSYLVACGMLGASSWTLLAWWVDSPHTAVAAMLLASLSTAFSDVVVDSIVVERSRGAPQATSGSLQSLCWASVAVGGIASAYFSGSLVQQYGTRFVFGLTALFPLVVSGSSLLISEQPVKQARGPTGQLLPLPSLSERLSTQGRGLWQAISKREILLPTAFVFFWQATPSADTAMFYFQTNHLHFTPEFLGRVRLAAAIASLCGVTLYNACFKRVPIRVMLTWAMVLGALLGSTTLLLVTGLNRKLGLSDQLFMLGDSVVLTVLGQVSFMPILVLAARLCPEGVEATLFATLMSILNAGSTAGSALGAALTSRLGVTGENFDNLALLVVLCNLATLAPAVALGLLPPELDHDKDDGEGGAGGAGEEGGRGTGPSKGHAGDGLGLAAHADDILAQEERRLLLDGVERGEA